MRLIIFTQLLLVGLACAAPTSEDDGKKVTITREYFPYASVKYTGHHDIVSILVPLNSLNSEVVSDELKAIKTDITIFFVEADIDENGKRTYQGLYVLKDGKAKKILENGRDAASSADDSKTVYLASTDGIYTYKEDDQTAVKYGSINDSLIGIAHGKKGNVLYILTEDNIVYEVKNNGNDKVKIDNIVNAQEILLDYSDNLYFYTPDKKVHVRTSEGIKDIEGLPENATKVILIKPPFLLDNGVPLLVDNVGYIILSSGTSKKAGFDFKPEATPTAFAMETMLIQFFAYDKKIYEHNILNLTFVNILEEMNKFFGI